MSVTESSPVLQTDASAPSMDAFGWFDRAQCGVFFHWGPYSVAGRGEWVMNRERIPPEEYAAKYIDQWRADAFDADAWMREAVAFGAGYVVLTVRHHDGFALWDSEVNANNSVRLGPQRDLVSEFVKAARRHGLAVGLYYSIANWTHPDYPGAFYRDWPEDDDWASEMHRERFQAYNIAELTELLSNYGQIDYLWYDGHYPKSVRNQELNDLARALQPNLLINDRNSEDGDVVIFEQGIRKETPDGRWEACFTLNNNWGYHENDQSYKRPEVLIELLCKVASNGGNLLLNLGPCGNGCIPAQTSSLLRECGEWIRGHRNLWNDAYPSPFTWNNSADVTVSGNSVYLHFSKLPEGDFCWAETEAHLLEAKIVLDGQSVPFEQDGCRIILKNLREFDRGSAVSTVELRFETKPTPVTATTTFWIPD